MGRGRQALGAALLAVAAMGSAAAASASSPPTPWDGANPFQCVLQQAGFGTTVPDPGADPYCVDFDKRHQSVADLGVVDFLTKEPARVAAASPKCFYFQSDHWRGSLVQDDPATKTYEWDGHYFFNKATGDGGVWVSNFNVNGHTFDPSTLPGMPPSWAQDFGPGTGGVITHDDVAVDPQCVAAASQPGAPVYAPSRPPAPRCVTAGGEVTGHRLGPVALRDSEDRVRALLGPPAQVKRGFLRWCAGPGRWFRVGEASDRSGELGSGGLEPAVMIVSNSPRYRVRGVAAGATLARARRAFPHAARAVRLGRTTVLAARRGSPTLLAVRGRRVVFLAVVERRTIRSRAALARYLRRALS